MVCSPFDVFPVIINLEAFFIFFIIAKSSSLSGNQAKLFFVNKSKLLFPDFAFTELPILNRYPPVKLISFLIFSLGLKLTKILDGSLFSYFGARTKGIDCAKQILFPSWILTKDSQSLNLPKLLRFSAAYRF